MKQEVIKRVDQLLKSGKKVVIEYNQKSDTYYIGVTKMKKWEEMKNEK